MKIDSAGRVSLGTVAIHWEGKDVFGYLDIQKSTISGEMDFILILMDEIDPDMKLIGVYKCDSKGRVSVATMLKTLYRYVPEEIIAYSMHNKVYIERR